MNTTQLIQPFGERSFELEKELLGSTWPDLFFDHAPFIDESIDPRTYLIVGRRGCGKSSLAEHFKHEKKKKFLQSINVSEAEAYSLQMWNIAENLKGSINFIKQSLVDVWEFAIWQLIFQEIYTLDSRIEAARVLSNKEESAANFLKLLLEGILNKFVTENSEKLFDIIDHRLTDASFREAQHAVLNYTRKNPIVVTIDSLEQYSLHNDLEMSIAASLIHCASRFNMKYSRQGLHLKVFITDEVFPYLKEKHLLNAAKHVRNPLFLLWRPKDLVRLVCWRFFKHLQTEKLIAISEDNINWESFHEVHEKLWVPFFGEKLKNRNGLVERTLPYILRHTQLRPRQLIMLCNAIAERAKDEGTYPIFSDKAIRDAVHHIELELADELINSYNSIYPNIGDIVSALSGLPMEFNGSDLDKIAHRTASQWPPGTYSPVRFRQVVTELGIVGRVRGHKDEKRGILEADFEFAMRDRLFIHEQDKCVIHPMLYGKINIQKVDNLCLYPFPDRPDFDPLRDFYWD